MKCSQVERTHQVLEYLEESQNVLETAQKFQVDQIFVAEIWKHKDEIERLHDKIHCKFCQERVIPKTNSIKGSWPSTLHSKHRSECQKFLNCFDLETRRCRICGIAVKGHQNSYEEHFYQHNFEKLINMPTNYQEIISPNQSSSNQNSPNNETDEDPMTEKNIFDIEESEEENEFSISDENILDVEESEDSSDEDIEPLEANEITMDSESEESSDEEIEPIKVNEIAMVHPVKSKDQKCDFPKIGINAPSGVPIKLAKDFKDFSVFQVNPHQVPDWYQYGIYEFEVYFKQPELKIPNPPIKECKDHCQFCGIFVAQKGRSLGFRLLRLSVHRQTCKKFKSCFDLKERQCFLCLWKLPIGFPIDEHFETYHLDTLVPCLEKEALQVQEVQKVQKVQKIQKVEKCKIVEIPEESFPISDDFGRRVPRILAKSRNRKKTKAQIKVSENLVQNRTVENYTNCLGYNEHIAIIEVEERRKFQEVIQDYEKTKNQVQKLQVANEL